MTLASSPTWRPGGLIGEILDALDSGLLSPSVEAKMRELLVEGAGRELAERRRELAERAPSLRRTTRLQDGTVGYFVRWPRGDDCWAAAVATCLQVPIDEVPDPRIDARLAQGATPAEIDTSAQQEMKRWLKSRGLRMVFHREVPPDLPRWLGVVPLAGEFNSHSMVMSHDKVLFDPVDEEAHERPVRTFPPDAVAWGVSFGVL